MTTQPFPRSPNVLLGGLAHLARMVDKVRMRQAGQIQDYNYLTQGFDRYLLDFLQLAAEAFEQRVVQGGTDEEVLQWVRTHGRALSPHEVAQWNERILASGPKDEATRQRFQARLAEVAAARGVPVESLPPVTTWVEVIELDEGRL
ncbi:MAG: DUF5069 domain-containing protein [Nitrospira sp.]|nr:DUF5069 domain-containing protein [Nitrospira sp.]